MFWEIKLVRFYFEWKMNELRSLYYWNSPWDFENDVHVCECYCVVCFLFPFFFWQICSCMVKMCSFHYFYFCNNQIYLLSCKSFFLLGAIEIFYTMKYNIPSRWIEWKALNTLTQLNAFHFLDSWIDNIPKRWIEWSIINYINKNNELTVKIIQHVASKERANCSCPVPW